MNFSPGQVRKVVVVLANASTRYRCDQQTQYACQGVPRDDHQRFDLVASVATARR